MDDFRSKSCKNPYGFGSHGAPPTPTGMQDLRCYSTGRPHGKPSKATTNKGTSPASRSWSFTDPELQRKKRVAGYKAYTVEGKMKGSIKKSFRWIKTTCSNVVYGSWR